MRNRNARAVQLLAVVLVAGRLSFAAEKPLPFLHQGDMVLFQGDSITDGGRQKNGGDFNHIMGQDYAFILAAEIGSTVPNRDFNFVNRGVGGDWLPDMAARWDRDTLALRPALLSILIGINDSVSTKRKRQTPQEFEAEYDALLAKTLAALPDCKIVLGEPFVLPTGKHRLNYAAELAQVKMRQQAIARLGAKYNLPVIHYQSIFDAACKRASAEHWSWDGIHPTYAGHSLMTRYWLRTVDLAWGRNSHRR